MIINRERLILAIATLFPEHIPVIFENCNIDFFSSQQHKTIYRAIIDLHEAGSEINLPTVADKAYPDVTAAYTSSLLDELLGVPITYVERCLLEAISEIKKEKGRKKLLEEISEQARSDKVDFVEIGKIAEEATAIERAKEKADMLSVQEQYRNGLNRPRTNLTMGFPTLDRHTDTFNYGELVTIMGRTATGKTFLGLNVLMNMVRGNREVREKFGFFSMEQPQSAIFERLLQIFSGKTRYDLKLMEEFERESIFSQIRNELNSIRIYEKIYSVAEISRIIDEEKFTVIFIDFLDLIRSPETGQSMYQQASQKMRELKQMAKTNNCLVILLVQLSRAAGSGDVPVTMEMCRDSGQIEELSDFLFGIWREKINEKENHNPYYETIILSLLKNKRGPIQNIKCRFDKKIGLIRELEFEKKEFS